MFMLPLLVDGVPKILMVQHAFAVLPGTLLKSGHGTSLKSWDVLSLGNPSFRGSSRCLDKVFEFTRKFSSCW
jgi:hypothetical protein